MNITDQAGNETAKRPRKFAQLMPEIFAVDAELTGDSVAEELSKSRRPKPKLAMEMFVKGLLGKSFIGDCCDKELRDKECHRSGQGTFCQG